VCVCVCVCVYIYVKSYEWLLLIYDQVNVATLKH